MSEQHSEELKRVCLICGCHTNQTINIYEPRSGPNIIQLIQAKFKFQPENEDKHLCFSCNNWLINWHSLQSVNSNESESQSQSGKFRCQLNGSIPEEQLNMSQKPIAHVKPQARVQPMQRAPVAPAVTSTPVTVSTPALSSSVPARQNRPAFCFSKRGSFRKRKTSRVSRRKPCRMCGRLLAQKTLSAVQQFSLSTKDRKMAKCRMCRRILNWRAQYLKSLEEEHIADTKEPEQEPHKKPPTSLVKANATHADNFSLPKYQRPLLDGKVVSMLRRVGTTLSWEAPTELPQIMTPNQQTTKSQTQSAWLQRPCSENEILIDFNTAITEVIPTNNIGKFFETYRVASESEVMDDEDDDDTQVIEIDESDEEDEDDDVQEQVETYCRIPKGLTISLTTSY